VTITETGKVPGSLSARRRACSAITGNLKRWYQDGLLVNTPTNWLPLRENGWTCKGGRALTCTHGRLRASLRLPKSLPAHHACPSASWPVYAGPYPDDEAPVTVREANGTINPGESCTDLRDLAGHVFGSEDWAPAPPQVWTPWQNNFVGPLDLYYRASSEMSQLVLPMGQYTCTETFAEQTSASDGVPAWLDENPPAPTIGSEMSFSVRFSCSHWSGNLGAIPPYHGRDEEVAWTVTFEQLSAGENVTEDPSAPPDPSRGDWATIWPNCATSSDQWCPGAYPPSV